MFRKRAIFFRICGAKLLDLSVNALAVGRNPRIAVKHGGNYGLMQKKSAIGSRAAGAGGLMSDNRSSGSINVPRPSLANAR